MKAFSSAFALAIAAFAAAQTPVSYSMRNGQGQLAGGSYNYWDQTYSGSGNPAADGSELSGGLGQLTDGVVGADDWAADLGAGNSYEWVGWVSIVPTITFDYGSTVNLDSMEFHTNNFVTGSVALWESIDFSFSSDGTTWFGDLTRTATQTERDDQTARYIQAALGGVDARYVRMEVNQYQGNWAFISEITTNGQPVPEHATVAALGLGFAALVRRKRSA